MIGPRRHRPAVTMHRSTLVVVAVVVAVIVVVLAFVSVTAAQNVPPISATSLKTAIILEQHSDRNEAVRYLEKYGYMTSDDVSLMHGNATAKTTKTFTTSPTVRHAISRFQEFYGLPVTGYLTDNTLRMMRKPRCGVKDITHHAFHENARKWPRTHLRWNFQLADAETLRMTKAAFDLWSQYSSLTFTRDAQHPDILISYRSRSHTNALRGMNGNKLCEYPFDGPGIELAHAYFPTGGYDYVSEVHIDEEEPWHIRLDSNPPEKLSLVTTLTHEIGHALGLQHSVNNQSIMFPFMSEHSFPVKLNVEDIASIQNLYGVGEFDPDIPSTTIATTTTTMELTTTTPTTTTESSSTTTAASVPPTQKTVITRQNVTVANVDLCDLRRIDVALIMNRRLYIAYRKYVWSISLSDRLYSEPLRLTEYMHFLPREFVRLSAVYQRPSGDLVVFVGDTIYMVDNPSFTLRSGWPKKLTDIGFPKRTRIHSVINTHTGRTFVIYNDDKVAEIDECLMLVSRHSSLRDIFPGIPTGIKSAFRNTDGNLYFFTHRQYYSYNEFTGTVLSAGQFGFEIIGIECPRTALLHRIQDILTRLFYREGETFADGVPRIGDEEEEDGQYLKKRD